VFWSDGKFSVEAALNWQSSSVMLFIMPVTMALTIVVGFILSRRHHTPTRPQKDGGGA
jgi:hypothetical protein